MIATVIAWTVAGWITLSAFLVAANYRARRNLARQREARAARERHTRAQWDAMTTHAWATSDWSQFATAIDLARRDFRDDT